MAQICLNVSDEFEDKISEFSSLALAKILEKAIESELEKQKALKRLEELSKNSEFTEEDAMRLGELAKQDRLKELKKRGIL